MGGMGQGFGGFLDLRENIFFLNRNTQGLSSHHESRFFYMSKSEFVVSVIDKNRSFFCAIFFAPTDKNWSREASCWEFNFVTKHSPELWS